MSERTSDQRVRPFDLHDALVGVGFVCATAGVALLSVPAALIFAGVVLAALGLAGVR